MTEERVVEMFSALHETTQALYELVEIQRLALAALTQEVAALKGKQK